ncbi:MAG: hypothetical protein QNK23_18560 [Crocinitomicaceae bacterium]|nr:hypothetical protein [Crocinitomicaceae bacterium]
MKKLLLLGFLSLFLIPILSAQSSEDDYISTKSKEIALHTVFMYALTPDNYIRFEHLVDSLKPLENRMNGVFTLEVDSVTTLTITGRRKVKSIQVTLNGHLILLLKRKAFQLYVYEDVWRPIETWFTFTDRRVITKFHRIKWNKSDCKATFQTRECKCIMEKGPTQHSPLSDDFVFYQYNRFKRYFFKRKLK